MKKKKAVYEGKMKLRKDDEVVVLSGRDKGKRGKVRQAIPEQGKVVIDGVNIVTKHRKPRSTSQRAMVKQQLGEMQVPMGLSVDKVALVCPKCHKEARVGSARGEDGAILRTAKKAVVRECRECGGIIDD